jgi:phenylalanine-4-hydroxylase
MNHIESRPSITASHVYDFFVALTPDTASPERLAALMAEVKGSGAGQITFLSESTSTEEYIPWFPRKPRDLDAINDKCLQMGEALASDHPGATDPEYRSRRVEVTALAKKYRHGEKIPEVEYSESEKAVWKEVFTTLSKFYPTHACKEHRYIMPLLESNCGYTANNVPQLQHISEFLQDCTGWRLRPVTGLLSSRDFLAGLAFRVFHSTQYLRHPAKPLYTPEPDLCHEILGHVPLFADPAFAAFSQEIGLASLGASDEDIAKLASVYWFTVEFGLTKEGDSVRAYGAGLLSSFGELEYALSGKPKLLPFDPAVAAVTEYPITTYQPTYFVTESFEDAKKKISEFAKTLNRPFSVRYNPYTQNIEVLDSKDKILQFANILKSDFSILTDAIYHLKGTQ